jgi:cytochrome c biogenesis protein CcmG/thiol:disulfide interchange protein DsbE
MRWVVIGAAALLVGLLAYGVASQGADTTIDSALQRGRLVKAPATTLPRLGEPGKASVSDYRGKVVLVNFWASWCGPCTKELPTLEAAQKRMERGGGTVLGINIRDNTEDAMRFVRRFDLTFPSLRDGSGDETDKWGVTGYPESYLLDRDGRVVAHSIGPVDDAWIDEHVTPLLRS